MATNYNPSATADDSCVILRATFKVTNFGYYKQCFSFVDENGNRAKDTGEKSRVTDITGYADIIYQTAGSSVVAGPGTTNNPCTDTVTRGLLYAPLLTDAEATIASPLTTVATYLKSVYNLSSTAASNAIWSSLSIEQQSVWDFDAMKAGLASGFRLRDSKWLIRQQQVLNVATYLAPLFTASGGQGQGQGQGQGLSISTASGSFSASLAIFQALSSVLLEDGIVILPT